MSHSFYPCFHNISLVMALVLRPWVCYLLRLVWYPWIDEGKGQGSSVIEPFLPELFVVPKQVAGFQYCMVFSITISRSQKHFFLFFSRTSTSHHDWPWLVEPLTEDTRPQKQLDSTQGGLRPTVTQVVTPVVGGTSPVPSGDSPFAKP